MVFMCSQCCFVSATRMVLEWHRESEGHKAHNITVLFCDLCNYETNRGWCVIEHLLLTHHIPPQQILLNYAVADLIQMDKTHTTHTHTTANAHCTHRHPPEVIVISDDDDSDVD